MKILLVQTSFLGDTILSTPVISGIKKRYPDCRLWMMTTPLSSSLVKNDPLLEGVISFDKRGKYSGLSGLIRFSKFLKQHKFDKVYSLHKSFRTSLLLFLSGIPDRTCFSTTKAGFLYHRQKTRSPEKHDVIRNLEILDGEVDISALNTDMRLYAPERLEASTKIPSVFSPDDKYAVLVPGSAWATKMWHVEGYKQVAEYLVSKDYKVVLTGSADDAVYCEYIDQNENIINLAGKTSVAEAIYIIQSADLVVCNDSMALHMASACKIPTAVIFCSTIPEFGYGPWNNKAIIIEKKLSCRPCGTHGKKVCPKGTNECMETISHETVIEAINKLTEKH